MNTRLERHRPAACSPALALLTLFAIPAAAVPVVAPEFAGVYSIQSLGEVPGLPLTYGGLTFIDNDAADRETANRGGPPTRST
jgi:hypothetical protein